MIRTFKHSGLEKFFKTGSKAGIQPAHAKKLEQQLVFLNRARQPLDMNFPAGNSINCTESLPDTGRYG